MTKEFKFNWQEEPDGFLKWFVVTILPTSGPSDSGKVISQLSELTDHFQNVELAVLLNGVKMDTEKFINSVQRNMEHYARQEAVRMLHEVGGFSEVQEQLDVLRLHFINEVEGTLRRYGIELPEYDD